MPASVRIDASRLRQLLTRAGGPGEQLLLRRARRVEELARQYSQGHGTIPQGISTGPVQGMSVKVLSSNVHTLLVHNGSRRHIIRPRRSGGFLRFQAGGRTVYARRVNHPGYRGDPFMTRALRDAR